MRTFSVYMEARIELAHAQRLCLRPATDATPPRRRRCFMVLISTVCVSFIDGVGGCDGDKKPVKMPYIPGLMMQLLCAPCYSKFNSC